MTLLELLRAAKPSWDVVPPSREPVPGALGGFEAEADAKWTVEMRDAAGSILALYAAVKACEARIEAGRAPLRPQRKALISALRAFEA